MRIALPRTNIEVFPLGLGTADFGTKVEREGAFRLLDQYAEAGGNFLDSAHCYGFWRVGGAGNSERVIGDWIRKTGHNAVVCTKGGHPTAGLGYIRQPDFLAPELLAEEITESLERLKRPAVEIFYLHRDDGITPVAEIIDYLNEEIDTGRVRYLGASNWSVRRITEANQYAQLTGKQGFVVAQSQWSLAVPNWTPGSDPVSRYIGDEDLPWYSASEMTLVPYSATANGFFSKDGQSPSHFSSHANFSRYARALELAEGLGATATQVALAWLRSHPFPVVPLFSTTNMVHLQEALGAITIELSPGEAHYLRNCIAPLASRKNA